MNGLQLMLDLFRCFKQEMNCCKYCKYCQKLGILTNAKNVDRIINFNAIAVFRDNNVADTLKINTSATS